MLIGNSSVFKIINDLSRQLLLIKTPSDFNKGLNEAFQQAIPEITLFALFRLQWKETPVSLMSSNYLNSIYDIPLQRDRLEQMMLDFISRGVSICNKNIEKSRESTLMPLINTSKSGSEILIPLIPVNEPVGFLYLYSQQSDFFDEQKRETFQFIGNMISRTLNLINYQAHQIKSHRMAELEVVNQKNFMNEVFDYLPINVFIKDMKGKYLYINKNAEESIGVKLNDAIGKTVYQLYPEETARKLEGDDIEVIKTKHPILNEHEISVGSRKRHIFSGRKVVTTSENKELLIGFSIDITQNIQASKTIEDQKKFYQQIFNTVPNYIYVKDKSGKFLLVNDAFTKLFNLTQNQILIEGIFNAESHQLDEELNSRVDQKVTETGETVEFEESLVLPDGEKRWYHTTKKPLPNKEGEVNILGISVDITDRKRYSDELIKAKLAKEQFLANMSHEIRTPINGIAGMVNLLDDIPSTEEQKKYLSAIKTSSENLQVIINDILDLSAIETGNIRFERIGFSLKNLMNNLINSFNYAAKQKGISITLNFDPYIDQVLIGDPVRLNQVLSNLIGNAVKFTKQGYVKVYALKINDSAHIGKFQFIVDDSGIGIAEEKIHKVFDNFEQGDLSINRKYGGTGLGLAIVKQLVQAQKGSVRLESKPGKGTKFTVDIQLEIGNKADLDELKTKVDEPAEEGAKKIDLSKYKLLLVEDNEVNILYTRKILQNWNCTPDEAKNGLIALEKLKENTYDLILMDVRMPVMDGFEASKFIRSNFESPKSQVPIIALTANAIKGDDEKCIQAGMNDYISKPFQPDTLKNKIISNMNLEGNAKHFVAPASKMPYPGKTTDLTYLKEMSNNDRGFIVEMIQSFITQMPRDIENIWFHFANEDYNDIANLVHKIKPAITFMGIHDLKDLVLEIEEHAKNRNPDMLESQLKIFDRTCGLAIVELKEQMLELG
jgi:PAS domain S-box-containing protein